MDYHFISLVDSLNLEGNGEFAELVTFRGVRYGVTKREMETKMAGELPPAVVLEPDGLKQYEKICAENGWDIFKVFVSTPENIRIDRLTERTAADLRTAIKAIYQKMDIDWLLTSAVVFDKANAIVRAHTDRLLSITGEERGWMRMNNWDAIVNGEDINKAATELEVGVKWRNLKRQTPQPWGAVSLPK